MFLKPVPQPVGSNTRGTLPLDCLADVRTLGQTVSPELHKSKQEGMSE